jgi:hypothetical protein
MRVKGAQITVYYILKLDLQTDGLPPNGKCRTDAFIAILYPL